MNKFREGEVVRHLKTSGLYRILRAPDNRFLEYCDEKFYEYQGLVEDKIWVRRQSEMEDGRFVLVDIGVSNDINLSDI